MSLFLEVCVSLAMLGVAVYTTVMSWVAIVAHKAKLKMSAPAKETHPPYITGEDLLG